MPVSEELVELACAAEQQVGGPFNWPDEWIPELADEYRAGMRTFLSSIVPYIEATALEEAALVAEDRPDGQKDDAAQIVALIRSRISELKR